MDDCDHEHYPSELPDNINRRIDEANETISHLKELLGDYVTCDWCSGTGKLPRSRGAELCKSCKGAKYPPAVAKALGIEK